MTDLAKITTPFGLLDEKTREALKAHGGPYEFWAGSEWLEAKPNWCPEFAYRVRPEPPAPREFWINEYPRHLQDQIHSSAEEAERSAYAARIRCIHVREVIEE